MEYIDHQDYLGSLLGFKRNFDLIGCKTPEDIERRFRQGIRRMRRAIKNCQSDEEEKELRVNIKLLNDWMDNSSPVSEKTAKKKRQMGVPVKRCGMQYRIIAEAEKDPDGFFANCLRYGIDNALEIEDTRRMNRANRERDFRKNRSR